MGPAVDLVEAVYDLGGEPPGRGHRLDGLDGPLLGAGDHVVDLLAGQPGGQAVGLPDTQLAESGVGDGGGVDDGLRTAVADEDYVHGCGRYWSVQAARVLGAVRTPTSTSMRSPS